MDPKHNRSGGLADILSNRPLILGLLFIGTYFAPFLILIGLPLAYVFRSRPEEEWEQSHFQYLIRTVWQALAFVVLAELIVIGIAFVLDAAGIAATWGNDNQIVAFAIPTVLIGVIALAYSGVRIIVSLMKSASRIPISNPRSWLI